MIRIPRNVIFALTSLFLIVGCSSSTIAQTNSIDGIWEGVYTSTYSTSPTKEVLMFKTLSKKSNEVVGVYLSKNGSAGILSGISEGSTYCFVVRQPVSTCPQVATGVLNIEIKGDQIDYFYYAESCAGVDIGHGKGKRIQPGPPPTSGLPGFWEGTYTSTGSPQPTKETFYFEAIGNKNVVGVYLSQDGATGILTGPVISPNFTFIDTVPDANCPSKGTVSGQIAKSGTAFSYTFTGRDCAGKEDNGKGKAKRL
jgi:hypothetical protein